MKTVTLEGDIYNPTGTLEGGYTNETIGMLKKVKELQRLEDEKKYISSKLLEVNNELVSLKKKAQDFQDK